MTAAFAASYQASVQPPECQASGTNFGSSVIHVSAPGGDFALPGSALVHLDGSAQDKKGNDPVYGKGFVNAGRAVQ